MNQSDMMMHSAHPMAFARDDVDDKSFKIWIEIYNLKMPSQLYTPTPVPIRLQSGFNFETTFAAEMTNMESLP